MFSCCVPIFRGPGFQKPRGEGLFTCCRHWLNPCPRRLGAFARRCWKSSTQETGQELNDGIPCPTSLKDKKESPTANKFQRWLRARKTSTVKSNGTCVVLPQRMELLKKRVEHLLPAFLDRDLSYVSTFLATYRAFATTQEVLNQLLTSYRCVLSSWDEIGGAQEQRGMAISSILGTWLGHYPEDFFQPPEFPCLKTLLAYVGLNLPGSDLEQRAWLLLSRMRHLKPAELEPGAPAAAPERDPEPRRKLVPAPTVVPAAASEPELENPTTAAGAQQLKRAGMSPALSGPVHLVVRALIHREDGQESPAPLESQEPQQVPAPAMEVPEEPVTTPPISEPQQDILTALTPCQELEDPPAPYAAPAPAHAAALAIEVPEGPLMPLAMSEEEEDTLTALTNCHELQELPASMAAPETEQAPARAMEVPEGPLMPPALLEPAQDILTALTPCQELQEPPAPLAAPEPEQAPVLAMEVPEEPVRTPAISEPRQDILTALTLCQELEESPAPLAAPESKQAIAPVIRVAEGRRQPPLSGATGLGPRAAVSAH